MKMPMELEALGRVLGIVLRKGLAIPTGFALLIAAGLLAGALIFTALTQRYTSAPATEGAMVRVDGLTGDVDICLPRVRQERQEKQIINYLRYQCGPELEHSRRDAQPNDFP